MAFGYFVLLTLALTRNIQAVSRDLKLSTAHTPSHRNVEAASTLIVPAFTVPNSLDTETIDALSVVPLLCVYRITRSFFFFVITFTFPSNS